MPTIPGETYNVEITWTGRGSNPYSLSEQTVLHTYPSPIPEDEDKRVVTSFNITIEFSSEGSFQVSNFNKFGFNALPGNLPEKRFK